MQQFIINLPTLKEIEVNLFQQLQAMFAEVMVRCLEEIDSWIMANRDHTRYRLRDKRQVTMSTSFGEISFSRRLYQDREKGTYVYLLDQALAFDGQTGISPHLEEWAVELATAGPSYHESARQIKELLGYQAISHETIRQRLIAEHDKINGCEAEAIRPSEREHVVAAGISPRRMIEDAGQQLGFLAAIPAKNRIINDERSNAGRRG